MVLTRWLRGAVLFSSLIPSLLTNGAAHAEPPVYEVPRIDGIAIDGATCYVKFEPCYTCAKVLVNCGIKRVVCQVMYQKGDDTRKLFRVCKIKMEVRDKTKDNLSL